MPLWVGGGGGPFRPGSIALRRAWLRGARWYKLDDDAVTLIGDTLVLEKARRPAKGAAGAGAAAARSGDPSDGDATLALASEGPGDAHVADIDVDSAPAPSSGGPPGRVTYVNRR